MKVSSSAGDMDVLIKDQAIVVKDAVILNAEMGVWQFQIYLSPSDFRFFFSLIFSSPVLLFLIKLPFQYIFSQTKK